MNIEIRDDAIRWLEEQGLVGAKRDWGFGETVIAAADKTVSSGITAFKWALCIHPHNDAWAITDLSDMKAAIIDCGSLQAATQTAATILAERMRERNHGQDSQIDD